jgi:hypothetical protein
MTLVGWVVAAVFLIVIMLFVLVLCALRQRRDVRAGLRIPGAVALFFEAKDRADDPRPATKPGELR